MYKDTNKRFLERNGKQYVAVCASTEVLRNRGRKFVVDECTDVAVFRVAGTCYALSNVCPHQHQAVIADGILERETVICPMHGWQFNIRSGQEVDNLGKIKTYETFEHEGFVYVEYTSDSKPAWMQSDV